jgi:hypothetical protein
MCKQTPRFRVPPLAAAWARLGRWSNFRAQILENQVMEKYSSSSAKSHDDARKMTFDSRAFT